MPPFAFVVTFALPLALPLMLGLELMLWDIEFIAPLACDWALPAALIAAPVAMSAAPIAVPATSGGGLLLPELIDALADAEPEPDADTLPPFWPADMLADGVLVLVDGALIDGELELPIIGATAMLPAAPSVVSAVPTAWFIEGMLGAEELLGALGALGALGVEGFAIGGLMVSKVPMPFSEPIPPKPPTLPPSPPPPPKAPPS